MALKFGLQDKLKGVITRIAASVKETKATWSGFLEFDWSGVTLADVLESYAAADRRITWANTNRKNIADYRGRKTVTVAVAAPGVRERVGRVFTADDAVTYLATLNDADRDAIIESARTAKTS